MSRHPYPGLDVSGYATLLGLFLALALALAAPAHADTPLFTCHTESQGECTETHLGTAPPKPDGRTCSSRSDCLPTEFCGAGVCRTVEGETATLCINRLWLEGNVCSVIDAMHLYISFEGPDAWLGNFLVANAYPVAERPCTPVVAEECVQVDLEVMARNIIGLKKDYSTANPTFAGTYTTEFVAGHQQVLDWLDAPCRPLAYQLSGGSGLTVMGEVSLWYP